ncbi:MAG: DUF4012 domain-containing protein, partial [Candidatus Staskawiczbacteria bacterium]|nr:DUF4012 domain-containing protein [Candidatus Staskawiczbacteria bacterium]
FYRNFEGDQNQNFSTVESVTQEDLVEHYRAESDWFQVSLAMPSRISELKEHIQEKNNFKGNTLKVNVLSRQHGSSFRTFLILLVLFLVPVATGLFLFGGGGDFVKTALGNFNSKLLSTSSFTLVNSQESDIFPDLIEFSSQIKNSGLNSDITQNIADFLQKNADFSWLNIFKKKSGSGSFLIANIDNLSQVKNALNTLNAENKNLSGLSASFANYIYTLSFWNNIFSPGKNYLIVMLNQDQVWPGGGEPKNYIVASMGQNGIEPISSGRFSDLDAAFNLKVVPPNPVKVISTSWLPSQSFWFMDFSESAKTVLNFFENTTGKKIDGVIAVNEDFLKDLSFKESLTLDTASPSWFYGLTDAIGRKPAGRWVSLASILNQGLTAHKVQFYFKDAALQNFAETSGWLTKIGQDLGSDFLGISWASLKGENLNLELAEYRAQVFQDGSLVVKLNLMVRQNSA